MSQIYGGPQPTSDRQEMWNVWHNRALLTPGG
jgi:hypothetical protein